MANKNHLVITAIGGDKTGLVNQFARLLWETGCSIVHSRMTALGDEFALIALVSGNWNAIAKIENALPGLAERLGLQILTKRTSERRPKENLLPYAVEVVSIDQAGVIHKLTEFFSGRNINIEDLTSSGYTAAHTGTPMFTLHITVGIPADVHIGSLREEFMDFCEELNVDAVIEPIKG